MNRKLVEGFISALGGLLAALAFPKFNLSFFIWISLLPLLYFSTHRSPRRALALGFLAGLAFNALLIYWIPYVPAHYGQLPLVISLLIYFIFVAYLSLYWGLFAYLGARTTAAFPRLGFFLLPFYWIALEYILGRFLTGFPWGIIGYTQHQNLYFLQLASLTGVAGLSFFILLFQSSFLYSLQFRRRKPFFIVLALILLIHVWGYIRLRQPLADTPRFTVGVIQGNVSSDIYWEMVPPQTVEDLFQRHLQLTHQAIEQGAGLVVWPEFSVPLCFSCPYGPFPYLQKTLTSLAQENEVTLLLGTNEREEAANKPRFFNTALCLQPDGSFTTYYKMHLVPFGEYTPYPQIFSFLKKVTHAIGDITPGKKATLHHYQAYSFGSPICYEIIFPSLVRQFIQKGANFLVTITNDGWYGTSSAPYQHFAIAIFRAVEFKRYLLRAATTGISGIIDPYGRVIARSQLMTPAVLTAEITPLQGKTLYARLGEFLSLISLTITGAFFILSLRQRKP
ncbi:MAG TPA: apolipoprotein N-acyltransferase [Candidatus Aminicenantes bacterium]|nr:apolipoprotein N-acyltransferase [Candidatus Aminicenantes bacterium]